LGTPITSPLLTVTGHRAAPVLPAVKWDDEGVEPQPFPLITNGQLVDYHTSRQTAPALHTWYERQGMLVKSRGCAVARTAGDPVLVRAPHLAVMPGTTSANIDELCKDVSRGLLIREAHYVASDQQLSSGSIFVTGVMFEIANGKIVRRVEGNGIEFSTAKLWKSLAAIGDVSTMRDFGDNTWGLPKGQPWRGAAQSATAPAGLFKDVNVVATKVRV
jgi:predicted Zn-dependent protease